VTPWSSTPPAILGARTNIHPGGDPAVADDTAPPDAASSNARAPANIGTLVRAGCRHRRSEVTNVSAARLRRLAVIAAMPATRLMASRRWLKMELLLSTGRAVFVSAALGSSWAEVGPSPLLVGRLRALRPFTLD
jgi:hypothetical protein